MNKNDQIETWGMILQSIAFLLIIPYAVWESIWILVILFFFLIIGFILMLYVDIRREINKKK